MPSKKKPRIFLKVAINGTKSNKWHKLGVTQNPFPQLGRAEWDERKINSLDGDPVKDADDIRQRLTGMSAEFIELCCRMFKPGRRVAFVVYWDPNT